jgi:hypothetical protein
VWLEGQKMDIGQGHLWGYHGRKKVTKGVEMEKNQACIGYNFLVEKEKAS